MWNWTNPVMIFTDPPNQVSGPSLVPQFRTYGILTFHVSSLSLSFSLSLFLSLSVHIFIFSATVCCYASTLYCSSFCSFSLVLFFSVHPSIFFFFCWIDDSQSGRRRPGIFLCPSSPVLSADSLSLPGSGSVGRGHSSSCRATTPPIPSFTHSDSALLRKSVSFTEDLLLAASGIVGLLCILKLLIERGRQWLQVTNRSCPIRNDTPACPELSVKQ